MKIPKNIYFKSTKKLHSSKTTNKMQMKSGIYASLYMCNIDPAYIYIYKFYYDLRRIISLNRYLGFILMNASQLSGIEYSFWKLI